MGKTITWIIAAAIAAAVTYWLRADIVRLTNKGTAWMMGFFSKEK